jgi:hypothetical protein
MFVTYVYIHLLDSLPHINNLMHSNGLFKKKRTQNFPLYKLIILKF